MRWERYVPMEERRALAHKEMDKLRKKGKKIEPVEISGRTIAHKFWGKKWCDHLESFADYHNRLERGRRYVRNGSVCHLSIQQGACEAIVSGSNLYNVSIKIKTLSKGKWEAIKTRCSGQIGSVLEILQGKLSDHVMGIIIDHKEGLFPISDEIDFHCSCPDWVGMCKHVAAVLYAIGSRLDYQPELLFLLRGVDGSELISTQLNFDKGAEISQLDGSDLSDLFGIDLDTVTEKKAPETKESKSKVKKGKVKLDLDKLTGKKLKAFRDETGMTTSEFAEALGLSHAVVYQWERSPNVLNLRERSKNALADFIKQRE